MKRGSGPFFFGKFKSKFRYNKLMTNLEPKMKQLYVTHRDHLFEISNAYGDEVQFGTIGDLFIEVYLTQSQYEELQGCGIHLWK